MSSVTWHDRPDLEEPVAVMAFEGWNDGGEAATMALRHAWESLDAAPVATLDHEEYADFQVSRPTIVVDGAGARHVDWPATEFGVVTASGRDVVLVLGEEPRLRWRAFCDEVADTLEALGVRRLVALGAFIGQVPHTLPTPIIGVAPDETRSDHELLPSSYSGPTGIVGVLNAALPQRGIDVVGLWAATPHYLAGNENPKAAQALLAKASAVLDVDLKAHELLPIVDAWVQQVSKAMKESDELAGYVETLEASTERFEEGDDLVEEIERFLREGDG
jgi:proteasome assembly chaperone (PAC2) family protein